MTSGHPTESSAGGAIASVGEPGAPKIKIESLSKAFMVNKTELAVLRDLNAEVEDEEFISIIGPSGGGKSTLLFIIAGLEPPTTGRVLIDGWREVRGPGRDRGLVFQQDTIFPWRTVIENVEYGLELRGEKKDNRKRIASEYLKLVDLERFANYWPKDLSGGMKKRVALAEVWANNPDVLLMDEPFGSLDYPTKVDIQNKLLGIWEHEKKSIIFVTHDIEEALFLSDRIFVLTQGNITQFIDVPFERPRTDELRTDAKLQTMREQLWRYIRKNHELK